MSQRIYDIALRDSLLDPDSSQKVAYFRSMPDGRKLYRIYLYLAGLDIPFVRQVQYILPPTFTDQYPSTQRHFYNQKCKVTIYSGDPLGVAASLLLSDRSPLILQTRQLSFMLGLERPGLQLRQDYGF